MRFAKLAQVGRLNPTRVWRLSEAEWAALQDRLSSAVTAAPGGPGVAPEDEEWGAALLEEASALFVAADQAAPADGEAGGGGGAGDAVVRLAKDHIREHRADGPGRALRGARAGQLAGGDPGLPVLGSRPLQAGLQERLSSTVVAGGPGLRWEPWRAVIDFLNFDFGGSCPVFLLDVSLGDSVWGGSGRAGGAKKIEKLKFQNWKK